MKNLINLKFITTIVIMLALVLAFKFYLISRNPEVSNVVDSARPVSTVKPTSVISVVAPVVLTPKSIGSVTRNALNFINKNIKVKGYLLGTANGYFIFSDESGGAIGYYDLPVTHTNIITLEKNVLYSLTGKFIKDDVHKASNGSPYWLELSSDPEIVK